MAKKPDPPAPTPLVRDDSRDLVLYYPGKRARLNPLYGAEIAAVLLALSIPLDRQSRCTLRGLKGRDRASVKAASKACLKMLDGIQWVIARLADTVDTHDLADIRAAWKGEPMPHTHPNGLPLPIPPDDGPRAA